MAKQVNIKWKNEYKREILEVNLRWTNKRGCLNFYIKPTDIAFCERCPFFHSYLCKMNNGNNELYQVCNLLWHLPGDNHFIGRENIFVGQPLGPLKRRIKNRI